MLQNSTYDSKIRDIAFKYSLYLPDGYTEDAKLPIVFFLHGAGEREPNPNGPYVHGPLKLARSGMSFPFICVAPQCPAGTYWSVDVRSLAAFIDDMTEKLGADENRVYLTGLSMGGFGTWHLAQTYPGRFAAIAPVCGAGFEWAADTLKNVPIWAFHGDADSVVPVSGSINMVNAIKKAGGNAKLTVYPGIDHDSWTKTYENPELYDWLLSHKRKI